MIKRCEHCGLKKEVTLRTGINLENLKVNFYLCDECYKKFKNYNSYFKVGSALVKYSDSLKEPSYRTEKGWTEIAKVVNIVAMVVVCILGLIIGAVLGDALSYEDGAGIIGAIIGGIVGFLIGGIVVSFSMVIVEISQKLSAILDELKKN